MQHLERALAAVLVLGGVREREVLEHAGRDQGLEGGIDLHGQVGRQRGLLPRVLEEPQRLIEAAAAHGHLLSRERLTAHVAVGQRHGQEDVAVKGHGVLALERLVAKLDHQLGLPSLLEELEGPREELPRDGPHGVGAFRQVLATGQRGLGVIQDHSPSLLDGVAVTILEREPDELVIRLLHGGGGCTHRDPQELVVVEGDGDRAARRPGRARGGEVLHHRVHGDLLAIRGHPEGEPGREAALAHPPGCPGPRGRQDAGGSRRRHRRRGAGRAGPRSPAGRPGGYYEHASDYRRHLAVAQREFRGDEGDDEEFAASGLRGAPAAKPGPQGGVKGFPDR
mmetsp:Transcript_47088/g.150941  ORF Transcript_47088/g.150941 Transcript_47088/m.150941 type:complete len:338 (+) Transcript_47088:804-1817(+)